MTVVIVWIAVYSVVINICFQTSALSNTFLKTKKNIQKVF